MPLRVRYAETDQMGVYYANYPVWMEGRVELCKSCGFNYKDMENRGWHLFGGQRARANIAIPPLDDGLRADVDRESQHADGDVRLRNAAG
jgi:hypothetical protein